MPAKLNALYDKEFYSDQIQGSLSSAKVILGILFKLYKPQSVLDLGCGRGAWLAAAESLGSRTLKGMDGAWVERGSLVSRSIDFEPVDLWKEFEVPARYDLAISVEVAEHLPEARAKQFVSTLCRASDVVLFSGAAKYQGGTNHVNEQWQSYWAALFSANDYECFDIFRWRIWHDEQVEWWYRQNVLLFVKRNSPVLSHAALQAEVRPILDAVHPITYSAKAEAINAPTLKFCLGTLKRFAQTRIGRVFGGARGR